MSMSLTISQPAKVEFGGRTTHDFSPRISLAKSRVSPQPRIDSPLSSLRVGVSSDSKMTTPHRGLPPPAAMTLPDPSRPPPSLSQPLGAMPQPPTQWQGQEESMRNWLVAKAEEDRRKQEEERTRQESYRLEQRRIEQSMLREALQAGVPPVMIPIIYASIGSSTTAGQSIEWLQQYTSQLQLSQQQVQQHSPNDIRRETRLIGQAYGAHQQQVVPSQPTEQPQQPGPIQTTFSAYQPGGPSRPPPTSAPRSATHTQLPRLTTNEMYVQPTHQQQQQQGPGSAHPLQQSQTMQQEQVASSPSIYFHHWVPPNETSTKGNAPQTPASKGGDREPHSAHPSTHLSESDYKESPRKRKDQRAHERPPPPSAGPQYTSPSFSTASSTSGRKMGHGRSRSNTESRPESRREPEPPSRVQSGDMADISADDRAEKDSSPPSLPRDESTTETVEIQRTDLGSRGGEEDRRAESRDER